MMQIIRRHLALIFVGSLIIGAIFAVYIPIYQCDQVGAVFCQIFAIVGYIAYGVAGLIACYSYFKMFKRCCKDCCQWCMLKFRGHRRAISQPLLRDSIQQAYNNPQNEIENHDDDVESVPDIVVQEQVEQQQEEQEQEVQEEEPYEDQIWEQYPYEVAIYHKHQSIRSTFNQNQCTICLVQFKRDDDIDRLACKHKFHTDCITDWLRRHQNCPICRIQVE